MGPGSAQRMICKFYLTKPSALHSEAPHSNGRVKTLPLLGKEEGEGWGREGMTTSRSIGKRFPIQWGFKTSPARITFCNLNETTILLKFYFPLLSVVYRLLFSFHWNACRIPNWYPLVSKPIGFLSATEHDTHYLVRILYKCVRTDAFHVYCNILIFKFDCSIRCFLFMFCWLYRRTCVPFSVFSLRLKHNNHHSLPLTYSSKTNQT